MNEYYIIYSNNSAYELAGVCGWGTRVFNL